MMFLGREGGQIRRRFPPTLEAQAGMCSEEGAFTTGFSRRSAFIRRYTGAEYRWRWFANRRDPHVQNARYGDQHCGCVRFSGVALS
jgi:hypothetical protein